MYKLYLSLVLVLTSVFACAQDADDIKGNLNYGIKAGGHVTSNFGSGTKHYAVRPFLGLHAGIFAKYKLTEKIALQQEIALTGRGIHTQYASHSNQQFGTLGVTYTQPNFLTTENTAQRSVTTRTDVYYVDLPLSAHYQITSPISVHAGIMYSAYLFRTKLSNTYTWGEHEHVKQPADNSLQPLQARDAFGHFEKHQFGVLVGGTYQFDCGLQAGLRYNLGLTRINRPVRAAHDLQYSMFQVSVSYDLSRFF